MREPRFLPVATFGLLLALSCSAQEKAQERSQAAQHLVTSWAATKADISKMEWFLLKAEVTMLRESLNESEGVTGSLKESTRVNRVGPPSYWWDAKKERITAVARVEPGWLSTASLEEVTKTLKAATASFCVGPVSSFELAGVDVDRTEENLALVLGVQTWSCCVRFIHLTLDKSNKLSVKVVAISEGNQLSILK
jgi:hypothetical protein